MQISRTCLARGSQDTEEKTCNAMCSLHFSLSLSSLYVIDCVLKRTQCNKTITLEVKLFHIDFDILSRAIFWKNYKPVALPTCLLTGNDDDMDENDGNFDDHAPTVPRYRSSEALNCPTRR